MKLLLYDLQSPQNLSHDTHRVWMWNKIFIFKWKQTTAKARFFSTRFPSPPPPTAVAGEGSVVGHVSGGGAELGVGLDNLVDGLQEVLLGGDLPAGPDGKHAGLCAHAADLGAWQGAATGGQKKFFLASKIILPGWTRKLLFTASMDVATQFKIVTELVWFWEMILLKRSILNSESIWQIKDLIDTQQCTLVVTDQNKNWPINLNTRPNQKQMWAWI